MVEKPTRARQVSFPAGVREDSVPTARFARNRAMTKPLTPETGFFTFRFTPKVSVLSPAGRSQPRFRLSTS